MFAAETVQGIVEKVQIFLVVTHLGEIVGAAENFIKSALLGFIDFPLGTCPSHSRRHRFAIAAAGATPRVAIELTPVCKLRRGTEGETVTLAATARVVRNNSRRDLKRARLRPI